MTNFRPAYKDDLAQVYEVFYKNEIGEAPGPPPLDAGLMAYFRHVLRTGTMYVAERDGGVVAFAGSIARGDVRYLTDLFVRPAAQSTGLGQTLLRHVLPADGRVHGACSSTDPRALALYIRSGMRPRWPHFNLRLNRPLGDLPVADVETVEARVDDPALARWDTETGGRPRPEEHEYWTREQRGVPLWFRRRGEVVGYGYARLGAGTLYYPQACTVGPIGARTPEDAVVCVAAAVGWASRRAEVLRIDLPGPHPALAPLLAAGFRIVYVETFLSTGPAPFFDARRYAASGSSLF